MRYVSLFSGIEAATVAWEPLGWEPVAFAEVDPFPCAVLAHHWPDVPNLGDVTKIDWEEFKDEHGAVDVVVGGSPCQSFSIAGGRESLDGESRLMFEYIRAVSEIRPAWFLWENVPGALSVRDNAFGQLLGEMADLGYGLAWRVLDAQFFGVAQRRRRVFLVGHLGDGGGAAAVLFDSESVRGNTQSSREKRKELARASGIGSESVGFKPNQGAAAGGVGYREEQAPTLLTEQVAAVMALQTDHMGQNGTNVSEEVCKTLDVASQTPVVCLQTNDETASTLRANAGAADARTGTNVVCMGSQQYRAAVYENMSATITSAAGTSGNNQPIVCVADDNSNAAIDVDMCGSMKVGGGCSVDSGDVVGALCARDYKGVGTQYVQEGKVVCQRRC